MKFGRCPKCGSPFHPIWYEEEETKVISGSLIRTGRKKIACSHLECHTCLNKESIDDTFDGEWY